MILESEKEAVIRVWEETEEYRTIVENVSGGSDVDVERKMRYWASKLQERPGGTLWSADSDGRLKQGERRGVKRRGNRNRKSNGGRQDRSKASKTNKCVSATKNSSRRREWRAQTSRRQRVDWQRYGRAEEVQASSEGEMRGVKRTRPAGKTKGEHEGKGGGFGCTGKQQETREEEEERVRMAPNMGAGGSHTQAMSDPGEEENKQGEVRDESGEEEQGENRRMRFRFWVHKPSNMWLGKPYWPAAAYVALSRVQYDLA